MISVSPVSLCGWVGPGTWSLQVIKTEPKTGRYFVMLPSGQVCKIKPENIDEASEDEELDEEDAYGKLPDSGDADVSQGGWAGLG